jgi:hypothetical protein
MAGTWTWWSWASYEVRLNAKRIIAIHQPNFFPWLGYFDKIARSDVFVILDNTQYSRGTWTNRVMLSVAGKPAWMTVPVDRQFEGTRLIKDIKIRNDERWREKTIKTIQMNYARAQYFVDVFPFVSSIITQQTDNLAAFNTQTILQIMQKLELPTDKVVMASTLSTIGTATDLLVSIVQSLNGTGYLCGGGASGYQEDEKFAAAGVALIYQEFTHPIYSQGKSGEFVPGLSIIDALMHCGFSSTRELLAEKRK